MVSLISEVRAGKSKSKSSMGGGQLHTYVMNKVSANVCAAPGASKSFRQPRPAKTANKAEVGHNGYKIHVCV